MFPFLGGGFVQVVPSPGALVTSMVLWFIYFLFATNLVNLGIFPLSIAFASLAFNLVEIPLAVLVGTRIYNRTTSST